MRLYDVLFQHDWLQTYARLRLVRVMRVVHREIKARARRASEARIDSKIRPYRLNNRLR